MPDLAQALPQLGVAQSLNLVLGMALQRSASLENEQLAALAQHYWARSQRTADLAFKLAKALDADAERCYSAGLLHCLGDLALLRCPAELAAGRGRLDRGAGHCGHEPIRGRVWLGAAHALAPAAGIARADCRHLSARWRFIRGEALVLNLAAQWARLPVDEDPQTLLDSRAARLLRSIRNICAPQCRQA